MFELILTNVFSIHQHTALVILTWIAGRPTSRTRRKLPPLGAISNPLGIYTQPCVHAVEKYGDTGGGITAQDIPDEPDVPDAMSYAARPLVWLGWRRVRRVRWVVWWFLGHYLGQTRSAICLNLLADRAPRSFRAFDPGAFNANPTDRRSASHISCTS